MLVVGCLALSSCLAKPFALSTLDKLEATSNGREELLRASVEQLAGESFKHLRAEMLAKIDAREASIRTEVYSKSEERAKTLVKVSLDQIDAHFKEIIPKLERLLAAAKEKSTETGDRTEEFEYASQLSSTLAIHARESYRLVSKVQEGVARVRDKVLPELKTRYAGLRADPELVPDVNALTAELMASYDKGAKAYLEATEVGYSEVRRFITDRDKAGVFLIQGALDIDGGPLAAIFSAVSDKATAAADKKLGELDGDLRGLVDTFIGSFDLGKDD